VYYTYVLQSMKDEDFYTGYKKNLKLRFEQHNEELVESKRIEDPDEI
jgi:putative endonuclease